MSRLARTALAALAVLVYLRSPIDLVPDFVGPPGLIDDLLVAIGVVWWLSRARRPGNAATSAGRSGTARGPSRPGRGRSAAGGARGAQAGRAAASGDVWDPWRILGISPGATRTEITRAYREQLKRYHPDRVADLGEELQALAHRKALDLRRAYEELLGS